MQDDQQPRIPQQPNFGSPQPGASPTYVPSPAPQPAMYTPGTLSSPMSQPNQAPSTAPAPSWVPSQPLSPAQSPAPIPDSSVQSGRWQRLWLSKKLLIAVLAAVALIGITATVMFLVFHKPITHTDVATALQAVGDLDKDLVDASIDYNNMTIGSDSNAATINSTADTINSKLDDAQKQLNVLSGSAVLRDGNVSKRYQALRVKFSPYVTYIRQNTDDNKSLMPVIGDFETSMKALSNTSPSTISEVSSYLQTLKSTVDSTTQRLHGIVIESSVNQQAVDALKTYLQSLSGVISQTQADMAAGKDAFTLQDDLFKSYDADAAYGTALDNANKQEEANQQKLDASSEVSGLMGAINSLAFTVRN